MDSGSFSDRSLRKSIVIDPKPLMLKDYLMDDLSSCSSKGFKSFPRRPSCCTTIRFLIEKDLKRRESNISRLIRKSRFKTASTTISVLQRASEAVINAVKYFPFHSVKFTLPSSSLTNRSKKGLLPRSLSKKLLKKSFWKKSDSTEEKEIKRWKLFREYLEDKDKPSDENTKFTVVVAVTERVSTSGSSDSNWTEAEYTSGILRSSSGNSECSKENDAVDKVNNNRNKVGITVGNDLVKRATTTTKSKEWHNEEKEQFSPISVLDSCPFQDEDETASPFCRNFAPMEGIKRKLLQTNKKSGTLAQLEPVNLEKRIAMSELKDNTFDSNQEDLVRLVKDKTSSSSNYLDLKVGNLLLDFFKERIAEENEARLLKIAEDWIRDQPQELSLGWEVEEVRKVYVKDTEKSGSWKNLDEEKQEAILELELDILNLLLKELLLDLVLMP